MSTLNFYELQFLDWIQENLNHPFLDWLMPVISAFANNGLGWIFIAVILLIHKKTRPVGITMGIALILGLLIGNITLKPLIARIRPFDTNTDITLLIPKPMDYSFPSGHTLASFESATAVYMYHRRWGIAAYLLAFCIAFSRMYLYVHYPTDVLVGILLGVLMDLLHINLLINGYC